MKGFFKIAAPLTRLTKKNIEFKWTGRCEKHFQLLKDLLTSAPVSTLSSGDEGYIVYCDVSRVGSGCVLMQKKKMNEKMMISYASQLVKEARAELPYS